MNRLAILGYGNMGSAFAKAVRAAFPDVQLLVAEVDSSRAQAAETEVSATTMMIDRLDQHDTVDVLADFYPDTVLFAVKPSHFPELAKAIKAHISDALILSLMAGVDLKTLEKHTGSDKIVRYLPNLAAGYGKSVTAVTPHPSLSTDQQATAVAVAESAGIAVVLEERLISSLIGISGSGIAFAFEFMHALALGGTQAGIAYPQSLEIAVATLEGAAAAVRESGINPAEFVTKVCSPGGTTINGIAALEQGNFTATVMQAVRSAEQRSREMELES